MTNIGYALARAELIHALTAYTGIATADGATPANNTIVDANLIGSNDFITEKTVIIMSGPAAYEDKGAASFVPGTGTITLQSGFSAQITAGTIFRILNISSVEIDVAAINTKIGTNVDAAGTTTLFARLRQIVDTYLASAAHGLAALKAILDTSGVLVNARTVAYTRLAGVAQIAATTIDLNQGIASYDLFTGTTQAVILESLNIKMPTGAAGGALTSISIQTDDATPGVIISAANGAVANLTSEADLGWTGTLYITVGTKIQLTIGGGAHGGVYVCNVTAKCRAVVSGGYLA